MFINLTLEIKFLICPTLSFSGIGVFVTIRSGLDCWWKFGGGTPKSRNLLQYIL